MIRVMIVARRVDVGEGLGTVLGLAEEIEVSEVVSGLSSAFRVARDTCPDVALVDLEMPEGEGCAAIRQLIKIFPRMKVIALTAHEYASARESAVTAGASAVMVKGMDVPVMVAVIQTVVGKKM